MKKLIIFPCLFFVVFALNARAIQEEYRAAEEKARVSYAFGMVIGLSFDFGSMGIDFDYSAFAEGLKAVIENDNYQFSEMEAYDIIGAALDEAMERQAVVYRQIEEDFLNENVIRPEVMFTESGLQFEIIEETTGEKPRYDSVVKVNYIGTLIDGTTFDSSYDYDGAYIPLDMVIEGWSEGLMLMSVGSIYRLYIPSYLAYGTEGFHPVIPPYSTLIFTVELLEIFNEEF